MNREIKDIEVRKQLIHNASIDQIKLDQKIKKTKSNNQALEQQIKDMDLQMMLNRNDVLQLELSKEKNTNKQLTEENIELSKKRDLLQLDERQLQSSNDQMNQQIEIIAIKNATKIQEKTQSRLGLVQRNNHVDRINSPSGLSQPD